jgi:hypothetical protein
MKKCRVIYYGSFTVLCCLLALTLSCGGGGEATELTQSNSPQAVAGIVQALDVVGFTSAFGEGQMPMAGASTTESMPKTGSKPIQRLISMGLSLARSRSFSDPLAAASVAETVNCSDGGTIHLSMSWDGPDDPQDISEIVDVELHTTFNNCVEEDLILDGTMNMEIDGPLDEPTSLTMYFDMSYDEPPSDTDFNMDDFSITVSGEGLDSYDFENVSMMMDGSLSGSVYGESIDIGFDEYTINYEYDYDTVYLTFSGKVRPSCLNAWLTVVTASPIAIYIDDDCPSAGDIRLSSGGKTVRAVIQSDFQIVIYLDDVRVDTLNDCEEMDGLCTA